MKRMLFLGLAALSFLFIQSVFMLLMVKNGINTLTFDLMAALDVLAVWILGWNLHMHYTICKRLDKDKKYLITTIERRQRIGL